MPNLSVRNSKMPNLSVRIQNMTTLNENISKMPNLSVRRSNFATLNGIYLRKVILGRNDLRWVKIDVRQRPVKYIGSDGLEDGRI